MDPPKTRLGNLSNNVLTRILDMASTMRMMDREEEIAFLKEVIDSVNRGYFPAVRPPGVPAGMRRTGTVSDVVIVKRHGTEQQFQEWLLAGKTPAVFIAKMDLYQLTYQVFVLQGIHNTPQGKYMAWGMHSPQFTTLAQALTQTANLVLETRPLKFGIVHVVRRRAVSGQPSFQFWTAAARSFKRVVKRLSGWT